MPTNLEYLQNKVVMSSDTVFVVRCFFSKCHNLIKRLLKLRNCILRIVYLKCDSLNADEVVTNSRLSREGGLIKT